MNRMSVCVCPEGFQALGLGNVAFGGDVNRPLAAVGCSLRRRRKRAFGRRGYMDLKNIIRWDFGCDVNGPSACGYMDLRPMTRWDFTVLGGDVNGPSTR